MASLLSWVGKKAKGVYDQANPFDNGRTYDTNQRGVQPGTQNRTNMKSDNTPGFQLTNNSASRGASRVLDQLNIFDNGKSWQQRQANTQRSVVAQSTPILKSFVKAPAQLLNTAAAQIPQVYTTGKMLVAAHTNNPVAFSNANREAQAENTMFDQNKGGLFNAGTIYNQKDAEKGDLKTGLKKIGGNTIQDAATLIPFAKGASAATLLSKTTPLLTKTAVLGAEGAGYNAAYNTGQQLQDTGKVSGKEVLKNAAIGAVVGGGLPVAAAGTKAIFKGGVPEAAAKTAKTVFSSPAERHPAVQALDQTAAQLNQKREQLLANGLSEKSPAVVNNTKALQALFNERQSTVKQIAQGGYVKLPGAGDPLDALKQEALKHKTAQDFIDNYDYRNEPVKTTSINDLKSTNEPNARTQKMLSTLEGPSKDPILINAKNEVIDGNNRLADYKRRGLTEVPTQLEKTPQELTDIYNQAHSSGGLKKLDENGFAKVPGKANESLPKEGPGTVPNPQPGTKEVFSPENLDSASSARPPQRLNTKNYNITKQAKKAMEDVQNGLSKEISDAKGETLTNKEVRQHMNATKNIMKNARTREATKNYLAGMQNLREDMAALAKKRSEGTITPEERARLNESIVTMHQASADAGRTLSAFRDVADPNERTVLDVMLQKISKTNEDMGQALSEANNLPDNPTGKQLADFYRKYVPSTKEDWLDKFRYTNMLSSPLTHIVNMSSNLMGILGAAPAQHLYEGGVDAARSVFNGGERTRFAGEAGSYYKGVAKSIPEAFKAFHDVMSDKKITGNPDFDSLRNIPLATTGAKGVADKVLSFVPKLLEAGDQFGTALAKGGEEKALINRGSKLGTTYTPEQVLKLTDESARYRLFRQELKKTGQGHMLDAVDIPAQTISKLRNSKNPYVRTVAKFSIPFISTPTNIFKQGIEYSPLGITTLHGAADKTAQVAKMLMGTTTVGLAAAGLAAGGDITFGEPTNKDQRAAFRAEGKQQYSFKLPGTNKWINYSKMHPAIAMNLAIVGAVKDAEDKGSITDSEATRIMNTGAGIVNYFTDQSYMKNVGDFVNVLQGKDNTNAGTIVSSQATNTANQLVPFKSLTSWVGRIVDNTQRKVDSKASTAEQIYQGIVKDIPSLNKNVPTRDNPYTKEPLKTERINSVLPWQVTTDKGFGNTTGLNLDQRIAMQQMGDQNQKEIFRRGVIEQKAQTKADNALKDTVKNGGTPTPDQIKAAGGSGKASGDGQIVALQGGKAYANVGGEWKTFDNRQKAADAIAVDKFKTGGTKEMVRGDTYYYKTKDGTVKTANNVQHEFDKQDANWSLEMDRAKRSDDVNTWLDQASQKYTALEKLKSQYDPQTEGDKITSIEKQQEDLQAQADKYNSYGGFTKGGGTKTHKRWRAPKGGGINLISSTKSLHDLITGLKVKA